MPQKNTPNDNYKKHAETLKTGEIGNAYIYHGDERYLLEHSLGELRRQLCPDGLDGFNYKRYEGKNTTLDEIDDAINTLPAFAERTMIELHDFDVFGNPEKQRLAAMLADVPNYACVVIIYDTLTYKPDGRQKLDKEILQNVQNVEFTIQDQGMLIKWIMRHYKEAGKLIGKTDAEYLVQITGGYMTSLQSEIEKTAAYSKGETVTRADIDAVVTPILDAVAYKLTDALIQRKPGAAMQILDELFRMREAPQKLIYSISMKMRQLLAARVCIEKNAGVRDLMEICAIRYEFQARTLMDTARKTTLAGCSSAVINCAETAAAINSAPDPESRLTELIANLAYTM